MSASAYDFPWLTRSSMLLRISSSGAPTAAEASETVNIVASVRFICESQRASSRKARTALYWIEISVGA